MTKEIPLTQGQVALVSDHRYDELIKWRWCALKGHNTFYAVRDERGRKILMHTQITGYDMTDHVDGYGLNNNDENLRECTKSENGCNRGKQSNNTSGYKGVSFEKRSGKWLAKIVVDKKPKHIGLYSTAEEAAIAYDVTAKEYHGEFAYLNFPP